MVSSVMLPAMKKDNYPEDFSAALNASAAAAILLYEAVRQRLG